MRRRGQPAAEPRTEGAEREQGVLADTKPQDQPFGLAILGHEAEAAPGSPGAAERMRTGCPSSVDVPRVEGLGRRRGPARAPSARARPARRCRGSRPAAGRGRCPWSRPLTAPPRTADDGLADLRRGAARRKVVLEVAADHHPDELARRRLRGHERVHLPPVLQDGDAIRDLEDLGEPMRDEEHADALLDQQPDTLEEGGRSHAATGRRSARP